MRVLLQVFRTFTMTPIDAVCAFAQALPEALDHQAQKAGLL